MYACLQSDDKGLFFRTLGNRGKRRSPRKTPPRDSPTPSSPNHFSSKYEKDRLQQLKQQLSAPTRKTRYTIITNTPVLLWICICNKFFLNVLCCLVYYLSCIYSAPEYYSLSLRKNSGGSSSSLMQSTKSSNGPNKRNSNSYSNLTDDHFLLAQAHNYPTSPKLSDIDDVQLRARGGRLPLSKSFDSDLVMNPPPQIPNKPWKLKNPTTGNNRYGHH